MGSLCVANQDDSKRERERVQCHFCTRKGMMCSSLSLLFFGLLTALLVRWAAFVTGRYLKYRHLKGPSFLLSLPLVGHGHLLGRDPIAALYRMRARYGPVFRLDIGSLPAVFICRLSDLAALYRGEMANGRPYVEVPTFAHLRPIDKKGCPSGVVPALGRTWQEQRRFMIRHLSDLGMGRTHNMEEVIGQECDDLVRRLKNMQGSPVQVKRIFQGPVNNVIWRMITGKRTSQDDPELRHLTQCVTNFLRSLDPGNPLSLLTHNSVAFCKLCSFFGVDNPLDAVTDVNQMIEKEISLSEADAGGNYIERFLAEAAKAAGAQEEGGDSSSFCGEDGLGHLRGQLQDIFVAGTETAATTLEWMLLYLVGHPDAQERMAQEISGLTGGGVGTGGGPLKLSHRTELHFCEAFIEEVSRHCPQGAVPIPHMTMEDCNIGEYLVPKGTQIFPFGTAINHDPDFFPIPERFDPTRFLDPDTGYFKKSDNFLFYGVGKRRCPGEVLGRAEVFYFLLTMVRNFRFSSADTDDVGSPRLDFRPIPGLTFHPKPFRVYVQQRT